MKEHKEMVNNVGLIFAKIMRKSLKTVHVKYVHLIQDLLRVEKIVPQILVIADRD